MNVRPRILIVDDEPFNLDYLEQELDDLGCDSVRAASGAEALEKTASESPDLILLDVMMPQMDGFQVLTRLKADASTRSIPVIIISAQNDLPSIVKGIEAGAEDYMPKPFNPTLLQARLKNGLEKKRLRDQEQLYLRALERELEIGREIQAGFLPEELAPVRGWDIDAYFEAARKVSGDFYDAFPLPRQNRLGLLIGDVCDKGVGAALFMTLFRSLLRAGVELDRWTEFQAEPSPFPQPGDAARVTYGVALTNKYIAEMHGDKGMFATVFLGLLDPTTGDLVYVNAGHEEPLVLSSRGIARRLARTARAVGILPDSVYPSEHIQLNPGETLLLLTDGASDALNEAGHELTREKLERCLTESQNESAHALLQRVASEVKMHIGSAPQFDDITMMAIRREE